MIEYPQLVPTAPHRAAPDRILRSCAPAPLRPCAPALYPRSSPPSSKPSTFLPLQKQIMANLQPPRGQPTHQPWFEGSPLSKAILAATALSFVFFESSGFHQDFALGT